MGRALTTTKSMAADSHRRATVVERVVRADASVVAGAAGTTAMVELLIQSCTEPADRAEGRVTSLWEERRTHVRQMEGTLKNRFHTPPSTTPAADARDSATPCQCSSSVRE